MTEETYKLIKAAAEFYKLKVIDTGMYDLTIGKGNDYFDADDWIKNKTKEWL